MANTKNIKPIIRKPLNDITRAKLMGCRYVTYDVKNENIKHEDILLPFKLPILDNANSLEITLEEIEPFLYTAFDFGCLKKSSDREDIDKEKEFLDYLLDKLNLKIIDVLIGGSTVLIKKDDYEIKYININVPSVFNPGIIIGKFGRDINYINRLFNVRIMSIKEVKGTEYSDYITEFRKLFREKMYG